MHYIYMKRNLFTIAEGHFYALVNHVISHFRNCMGKMAEPVIVGGLAVQIHIMDMILKAGMSPDCSHFRRTDDIDMDFPGKASKEKIKNALADMPPLEADIGEKLVFAEVSRVGEVKPVIHLNVFSDGGELDEEVKLNISRGAEDLRRFNGGYHRARYLRHVTVSFPHVCVEGKAEFPVVSLEDLIVSKATAGREKDKKDLSNIAQVVNATGRELDLRLTEASLKHVKNVSKKMEAKENYREFLSKLKRKGGNSKVMRPVVIRR